MLLKAGKKSLKTFELILKYSLFTKILQKKLDPSNRANFPYLYQNFPSKITLVSQN